MYPYTGRPIKRPHLEMPDCPAHELQIRDLGTCRKSVRDLPFHIGPLDLFDESNWNPGNIARIAGQAAQTPVPRYPYSAIGQVSSKCVIPIRTIKIKADVDSKLFESAEGKRAREVLHKEVCRRHHGHLRDARTI